ncbi:hypothetical protein RM528_12675 [Streptomyces sp. DSM 41635]|uniref:Uncharacterized protein n=1 Tax=Streptomyces edwardsiae TaxID=3075527 RepID=A0ABU2QFN5_9ACTN|nr:MULTISPECIES: hypothetical protein [unclassified Streptomyces]MDT0398720.1 hypothetical protein [Streptomyces sp. DSM 41636]MDT0402709.1 hypothetical protein [Streptomyces sp. DSM 41635]
MRTPTPPRPRARPVILRVLSDSAVPKKRESRTPTIGTPAISRPAVELDRWRSASVRVYQGPMISITANASIGFQCVRRFRAKPDWRRAKGSRRAAPIAQRANTTADGDTSSTATLIIR